LASFTPLRNPFLLIEIATIVGMFATTLVPPVPGAISVWSSIPALLYVRALFWIPGALVLPGLYLIRIVRPLAAQPRTVKLTLAPVISFALFGTLAVIMDAVGSIGSLPLFTPAAVAALAVLSWLRNRGSPPAAQSLDLRGMHKGYYILIAAATASIIMAALFQNAWSYLYPQDTWTSFLAGIKIITGRSVVEAFSTSYYPVAFGYIIAGISVCTGFPIVNAQALLIPFTALEVLSLFALARVVFGRGVYTSAIASLIFGFCGGIGWMILLSTPNWLNNFMYISNLAKDMYFGPFFFYSFFFYYKSLALMMAFASIVIFSISGKTEAMGCKAATAAAGALLMVWAFLIHMLPAFLAPMALVIAFISAERRQFLRSLLIYIVSALALLLAMDLMLKGIYLDLIFLKGIPLVSAVLGGRALFIGAGAGAAIAAALAVYILIRRGSLKAPKNPLGARLKPAVALALLAAYLAGGLFYSYSSYSLSSTTVFPWYLYVTRYGFIGVLAILGLYTYRWKAEWFKICIAWAVIAIAMGSLWWGERLNSYLFPVVAVLAGGALVNLLSRASPKPKGVARVRSGRRDPRWVIASVLLLAGLAVSFGSSAVSAYNFLYTPQLVTDDIVRTYNWAAENTTHETGFVGYPYPFTLAYGISTLSDRRVVGASTLSSFAANQAPELVANLSARGVEYIVMEANNPRNSEAPPVVRALQSFSDVAYRSGNIVISSIPKMALPGNSSQTVVLDWSVADTLRFLAISIPSLWPTGYSIVANSSLVGNASVVFTPYGPTINSTILKFGEGATVVLISPSLAAPAWGEGWATQIPGTLEGAFEGRRVIIVESDSPHILGNLTAFSQQLYGEVSG
jgi:hypothetical protein